MNPEHNLLRDVISVNLFPKLFLTGTESETPHLTPTMVNPRSCSKSLVTSHIIYMAIFIASIDDPTMKICHAICHDLMVEICFRFEVQNTKTP